MLTLFISSVELTVRCSRMFIMCVLCFWGEINVFCLLFVLVCSPFKLQCVFVCNQNNV